MVVIGGEERIVCQEATRKEREIRLYKIVGGFFVCVCVQGRKGGRARRGAAGSKRRRCFCSFFLGALVSHRRHLQNNFFGGLCAFFSARTHASPLHARTRSTTVRACARVQNPFFCFCFEEVVMVMMTTARVPSISHRESTGRALIYILRWLQVKLLKCRHSLSCVSKDPGAQTHKEREGKTKLQSTW